MKKQLGAIMTLAFSLTIQLFLFFLSVNVVLFSSSLHSSTQLTSWALHWKLMQRGSCLFGLENNLTQKTDKYKYIFSLLVITTKPALYGLAPFLNDLCGLWFALYQGYVVFNEWNKSEQFWIWTLLPLLGY